MPGPYFGLQFITVDDQPQPIMGANMDVVGIIGPCSTANAQTFPYNTPVLVFSNDVQKISSLGTDGYILDAIEGINAQVVEFQQAVQLVIVRTQYGDHADANLKLQQTIARVMGRSTEQSGVFAFLKAPNTLYCTPRIIIAPGYTGQMANSLDTLFANQVGVGYTPGQQYQIQFAHGDGETNISNLVLPSAYALADSTGRINNNELFIETYGAWMTVDPIASLPPPDGPPIIAAPAGGFIVFSQNPGVGSTITLNGTTVTFVNALQPGATTFHPTLTGGAVAASAAGTIQFYGNPQPDDTITLNGSVVTFVAATPTDDEVLIGSTLSVTLNNLVAMLNASADVEITKCTYTKVGGYQLHIAFDAVGVTGNAFTLAENVTAPFNQVVKGLSLNVTLDNLLTFLNASLDVNIALCNYFLNDGTLSMITVAQNDEANGFALATTVTGAAISGSHLSGGQDAGVPTQAIVTATIALGANPVCSMLTPVLNTLIAHAIVESAGTSYIADLNWRNTLNGRRLIGLSGGCKIIDPDSGAVIVRPLAPRMAGALIGRDFATGYPFHSAANRAIQGIVSPARSIAFSLTDNATEGQQILSANLGILVRGNVGVETAISSGGFILIATDNMGDDELWRMYNVVRGRDFIHLSLMPALRVFLGRSNIDRQTVVNIMATIDSFLGTLLAREQILGYKKEFKGALNSAEEIRLGHLTVSFAAEEAPVLKRITTMSARYRPAITTMVAELERELNFGTL